MEFKKLIHRELYKEKELHWTWAGFMRILNNFIFDFVCFTWSQVRQWSMCGALKPWLTCSNNLPPSFHNGSLPSVPCPWHVGPQRVSLSLPHDCCHPLPEVTTRLHQWGRPPLSHYAPPSVGSWTQVWEGWWSGCPTESLVRAKWWTSHPGHAVPWYVQLTTQHGPLAHPPPKYSEHPSAEVARCWTIPIYHAPERWAHRKGRWLLCLRLEPHIFIL